METPQRRRLGRSELEIPPVVIGLWAAGGNWWGPPDDDATQQAINRALELGYDTFDTAPVYGYGHSEKLLGKAARGRRQELLILTKGGPIWDDNHRIMLDLTPEGLKQQLDESLRRLQTDYVDLYQIHWPGQELVPEEVMVALSELQNSGKVRAIGCSNYSVTQLEESHRFGHFDSLQPPFNMIVDRTAEKLLPFCQREEVGVITYGPLMRGILTGKYQQAPQFDGNDIRSNDPDFQGERFTRINRFVQEVLVPLALEAGVSTAALALSWNYSQPGVTAAIAGVRSVEQVEQNLGTAILSPELLQRLDAERAKVKSDIESK
ncbi:MAG: aldo/keto reductase [Candidatus Delongbacteria bacterium]|nr:aldo/keto reductase [Candidatus Delongbacteria bacterium]